jgi:hypothetical protein
MNYAEQRRNVRISAMADHDLLTLLLADDEVTSEEHQAFADMSGWLRSGERSCLSKKQRSWAEEVARRIVPFDSTEVPRGREVQTPSVLQNLPKAPPGRRMAR